MNRKFKLFFSLASLCLSVAMLCFGVYSAMSVSYTVNGSVSYEVNDVFARIDLSVYRSMQGSPIDDHSANESTILNAESENINGFDLLENYHDTVSTYDPDDPEIGSVVKPGEDLQATYPYDKTGSPLELTYGTPEDSNELSYAFYIVLDITNYGSETINAQITAPSSLENTILRDSGNVEITADGTERIVLGLALDDVTTGISADFQYTITISCGELPEPEPITDMTFTFNEDNKTATLASYTGSGGDVVIPETIGAIEQTTKTGQYADIKSLMTSLAVPSTAIVDMYLVGDISYTSGNEPKVAKNQMISLWAMNNKDAEYTNIKIECKNSYTLTVSASDMKNDVERSMLYGPAAGYIEASQDNPTILDTMSMSYTIRLNNKEFSVDKNAVMQFIGSNSGELAEYMSSLQSILGSSMEEITISFEDIIYGGEATEGDEYTVTSITDGSSSIGPLDGIMPMFPSTVKSISLPNTLTYIQYRAFEGTQWLEGLRNQEGYNGIITSRDGSTKYYLETPQGVQLTAQYVNNILQDVQVIGGRAFYQTELSGDIVIPNGVKGIGLEAFSDTTISSVTFEDGSQLENIDSFAFRYCSNLTSIEIPSSVTSIGEAAFYNCSALKKVNIIDIDAWAMIDFGANANPLENAGAGLYLLDEKLVTEVTLTTATMIRYSAFSGYGFLTRIEIPSSVTSIGEWAFSHCSALETVTFEDNSQLESIGSYAFQSCSALTSIEIPSRVTSIGSGAFSSCSNLTSIEIPNSVTSIGSAAFSSCSALEKVNITDIDAWAMIDFRGNPTNPFENAGAGLYLNGELVTEVTLTTATKIGDDAFSGYDLLTSITIPSSVTSIGYSAFSGCSALETVTFGEDSKLASIGSYAFSGCSSLTSIEIPSSVTSIGRNAFSDCDALATVTFEEADSVWVLSDSSSTEISISAHTSETLADYLTSNYYNYTWTKKQ